MFDDKLLSFYICGLSYRKLVLKYFQKRLFTYFFIFVVAYVFLNNTYTISNWGFLVILLIVLITNYLFCMKSIWKYTKEKYDVIYGRSSWDIFLCAALKLYLTKVVDRENSEEALDFLISRLKKKLENKSKGSFFGLIANSLTLSLTVIIPVWAAFNNSLFSKNDELIDSTFMFRVIGITFFVIYIIRGPLIKEIIDSEVTKISSLIDKLEILKFSFNNNTNPYYYKEIDQLLEKKETEINIIIKEFNEWYEINSQLDFVERFIREIKHQLKNVKFKKHKQSKPFNKDYK
ncbi:hypothetical protein ACFRH9_25940 [Peribacillus butanolivorans]|uniref:hypothetical protein n=1 Tax=Peribacillus butanolivorans TaxID=421767 RepID=UPI00366FE28A